MDAQSAAGPSTSMTTLSLSPAFHQPTHIDLTLDDDDTNGHYSSERVQKRARVESSSPRINLQHTHLAPYIQQPDPRFVPYNQKPPIPGPNPAPLDSSPPQNSNSYHANSSSNHGMYRPAFAGPSSLFIPHHQQTQLAAATPPLRPPSASVPPYSPPPPPSRTSISSDASQPQVIDLTGSPSPPPSMQARQPAPILLPPELSPKAPVCIGQLTVTALVLYPVPYLLPHDQAGEAEWAPVRLQYEHNPHKPGGSETIHIKTPHGRNPNGEMVIGEAFGVVEQKVATSLGPMLGKGLIRLDAKVRKGQPNV